MEQYQSPLMVRWEGEPCEREDFFCQWGLHHEAKLASLSLHFPFSHASQTQWPYCSPAPSVPLSSPPLLAPSCALTLSSHWPSPTLPSTLAVFLTWWSEKPIMLFSNYWNKLLDIFFYNWRREMLRETRCVGMNLAWKNYSHPDWEAREVLRQVLEMTQIKWPWKAERALEQEVGGGWCVLVVGLFMFWLQHFGQF